MPSPIACAARPRRSVRVRRTPCRDGRQRCGRCDRATVLACAPVTVEGCLGPGLNCRPVPIALQVFLGLVLLVLASDAFANAVEWAGALLGLTRSAVGAVVAAIGSSLPETMVVF